MDPEFWGHVWAEGRTRFHLGQVHPDLVRHEERFLGGGPHRVLVPLCGKTLDMTWMAARGHAVVGVEVVPLAVERALAEQGLTAEVSQRGPFRVHRVGSLELWLGDVFDLAPEVAGTFGRIWDRAALVALDPPRRQRYVGTVRRLLQPSGLVLLNHFAYDQARMSGPPFSVPADEVERLWAGAEIEVLEEREAIEDSRFEDTDLESFVVSTRLVRP